MRVWERDQILNCLDFLLRGVGTPVYLEELKVGVCHEGDDERIDLLPIQCVHRLHVTTALIHLTSQLCVWRRRAVRVCEGGGQ